MDNKRISEIVDEEMIKQDANKYRDMRKILTIPKSIADELDSDVVEVSSTTDEKTVDNLEDHLLPYSKEMVQKIRDKKIQLVTVDEFVKLQKESLTAIRENDKLKEQLDTAKKALTEISEIINYDIHKCDYGCDNNCELNGSLNMYSVENVQLVTESTLAEIGEKDEIN